MITKEKFPFFRLYFFYEVANVMMVCFHKLLLICNHSSQTITAYFKAFYKQAHLYTYFLVVISFLITCVHSSVNDAVINPDI